MSASQHCLVPRTHALATTAVVLLERRGKPVYFNAEAIKVLSYPRRSEEPANLLDFPPPEIQRMLASGATAMHPPREVEFKSGRRRYRCTVCPLIHNSGDPLKITTALLIGRTPPGPASFAEIARQFHLTGREQETVSLLVDGLTSKEIACRMNVSPNTVKTFVRLVMTKMAVPTRSGIIGKLIRS